MRQAITFTPIESKFERDEKRSNEELSLFWKEALPEGTWKHPIRGFTVKVDEKRLKELAGNFQKQKERNIRVPVPSGHKYSVDVNNGFVDDVEVRKKLNGKHSLFVLMNVEKEEATKGLNKTIKDVSVSLNPNLKHSTSDGQVEDLGNCIEHVAFTNYPVIAGMGDFIAFDKEDNPVTVIQLDLISDEVDESAVEGFQLDPEQLQEFARDVAQRTLAALTVTQSTEKSQSITGEENMPLTPEQLHAMEKKFGLETDSLTDENWLKTLEGLDLEPEPVVPKEFDINTSLEFKALQEQNQALMLDRNERKLQDISRRLTAAQESGRINKAAYDKIVPEAAVLQFSAETCTGEKWDTWIQNVEVQLSIIEELPEGHIVSTQRQTAGHTSALLDQVVEFDDEEETDEEEAKLDKAADAAIMSAAPEYHKDSVKLDTKSGTFVSVGQ